jgi:hypothetical protein
MRAASVGGSKWGIRVEEAGRTQVQHLAISRTPLAVVAGHKRPGAADTPNIIDETRKYIRDFDRTAANTQTALQLYHQMLVPYPERLNPAVLWNSARAGKSGS